MMKNKKEFEIQIQKMFKDKNYKHQVYQVPGGNNIQSFNKIFGDYILDISYYLPRDVTDDIVRFQAAIYRKTRFFLLTKKIKWHRDLEDYDVDLGKNLFSKNSNEFLVKLVKDIDQWEAAIKFANKIINQHEK